MLPVILEIVKTAPVVFHRNCFDDFPGPASRKVPDFLLRVTNIIFLRIDSSYIFPDVG